MQKPPALQRQRHLARKRRSRRCLPQQQEHVSPAPDLPVTTAAPVLALLYIRRRARSRHAFHCTTFPPSNTASVSFASCAAALLLLLRRRAHHYLRPLILPRAVMLVCMALWAASFVLHLPVVVGTHEYDLKYASGCLA